MSVMHFLCALPTSACEISKYILHNTFLDRFKVIFCRTRDLQKVGWVREVSMFIWELRSEKRDIEYDIIVVQQC